MKKEMRLIDVLSCTERINVRKETARLVREVHKPSEKEYKERQEHIVAAFRGDEKKVK